MRRPLPPAPSAPRPGRARARRRPLRATVVAVGAVVALWGATAGWAAPVNEGFVAEPRPERGASKVTKLADDPGKGEAVPRGRLEASLGVWGAEGLPTHPGVGIALAGLYRPAGDFWIGGSLAYRALTGEDRYASVHDWSVNAEARYYFMPHREANRFVMGYLLLQLGYAQLAADGDDVQTRARGLNLGLGVAAGAALSTRVYLGLRFLYTIPVWLETCVTWTGYGGVCTGDPADFTASAWQLSLYVSRSF